VPCNIAGIINVSYKGPVSHYVYIHPDSSVSGISRIIGPCIVIVVYRFYNIIPSVEGLIADQLYLNSSIAEFLDRKNSQILIFVTVQRCPQYNIVDISVDIVVDCNVVNKVVPVKVKVVYP